ncbi:TIGR03086 family metal-binding protein [Frankia sp. Cr1]|uniref:TIGR03086 family metal-binding protein n=1 Tax=Frankia sp. Cr1 TaxID=3073931 RepID=UPI002AD54CC2|nr:TIGR03086 family metal-binding protein [Frankia sp. Cr1]
MSDTADRYRRLAGAFTETVAAVPADRWESPSPCEGWTARDVVRHVVDTHGMFLGLVGRELGDIASVDDDPLAAWRAARDAIQADLDDPARAGATFQGWRGPSTFAEAIDRFICFDQVVHRWDLARATGLDERMDPAEVRLAFELVPYFGDDLRRPDVCGPALQPPPGADEQTRLLAVLGRRA